MTVEPTVPKRLQKEEEKKQRLQEKKEQLEAAKQQMMEVLSKVKLPPRQYDPTTIKYESLPRQPMNYYAFEYESADYEPNYDYE